MTILKIHDIDIFYLSYDEPNKEEHWADILYKYPYARRVDGVKGFDAAHKACAKLSQTPRFVTVDGDNKIDEKFLDIELSFPKNTDLEHSVISWSARNNLNGLVYGNGGIKCWPVDLVLEMKTHEVAEDETKKLDFCWDLNYIQMNNVYSTVFNTATPFQAFRAGFREGVKMSLDQGKKVSPSEFKQKIWPKNYERLLIWSNVGAEIENGLWAIYGARLGCWHTNLDKDFNIDNITDYDWFKEFFDSVARDVRSSGLEMSIMYTGKSLADNLGMEMCEPTPEVSALFKRIYVNPPRVTHPMATEKQVGSDK